MNFLTEWLINIIVLIILATILEMLLPNSVMKRYVEMVVGILLLVVMIQPILSIITEDVDAWLLSLPIHDDETEEKITNSAHLQKREIQLGQRAYISEQVAIQLEQKVSTPLQNQFQLAITQLTVEMAEDPVALMTNPEITHAHVIVTPIFEENEKNDALHVHSEIKQVEMVQIDNIEKQSKERDEKEQRRVDDDITQFLATHWNIEKKNIVLTWEGG